MARRVLLLAFCHAARGMVLRNSTKDPSPQSAQLADIRQFMREENSSKAQAWGCHLLKEVLGRDSPDTSENLEAFRAAADAIPSGEEAALACIPFLGELAVFNRPMTLLLNRTDAMKNTIEFLRGHVGDKSAARVSNNIASMSTLPEIVPYVVQLGGIDVLFDYLEHWTEDAETILMVWAGLSDPSHGVEGARAIADHGGHNRGLGYILKKIKSYLPHFGKRREDTLTVRYESLQIVNGMLGNDVSNEYARAFLDGGLLKEITRTLKNEHDMRAANSVCCHMLNALFAHGNGKEIVPALLSSGIVGIINTAFTTFHDDYPMPWNGGTVGQAYPVIPECSETLANVAGISPEARQEMKKVGVPQTLKKVRPAMKAMVKRLEVSLV